MKDKNVEEQLAEKLGNRSIAPSQEAWRRIANNRMQAKKKRGNRFIYYAAACAVCVLSIATAYFILAEDEATITAPSVVNADKPFHASEKDEEATMPEGFVPVRKEGIATVKKFEDNGDIAHRENVQPLGLPGTEMIVDQSIKEIKPVVLPGALAITKDKLYEQEAEYLLDKAIKEMVADKYLAAPTNDTALLREVEAEMDDYYREKAMKIFSQKHKTIRIAVKDKH